MLAAGQAFMELSKDKSNLKQAEGQTQTFTRTLRLVESKLSDQINYLTQVSTGKLYCTFYKLLLKITAY